MPFDQFLQLLKAPWPVQEKVAQDKAGPTRSDDADRAGHRGVSGVLILHDGTLFSRCVIRNYSRSHYYVILSLVTCWLTSLFLVTIKNIVTTMGAYHDAQIPGYLLSFEWIVRLLVTIIALGLIWLGAARMPASAKSRYVTAGVLSAALIGWVAVAQYLGAANTYFAAADTAVPTVLFGLLIPLAVAAIALWRSESIARLVSAIPLHWLVAAQVYRVAGGIFLVLWADGRLPWQFALPAGIGDVATGSVAVVVAALLHKTQLALAGQHTPGAFSESPTSSWQSPWGQSFLRDAPSSCVRGAEPSRGVLSAGHGAHLRRSAGPDAPWPRFMAAAARCPLSRAAGSGLMPLASSTTPRRAARLPPSPSSARLPQWGHSRRSDGQQGFAECPLCLQWRPNCASQRTDAMCHVWTGAPGDRRKVDGASPSR